MLGGGSAHSAFRPGAIAQGFHRRVGPEYQYFRARTHGDLDDTLPVSKPTMFSILHPRPAHHARYTYIYAHLHSALRRSYDQKAPRYFPRQHMQASTQALFRVGGFDACGK